MSVTPLYNEFPSFLKRYFPYKVQKISLNAGFTCPNPVSYTHLTLPTTSNV